MSEHQITVEQLMKYALGVQRGSVTPAYLEKAILIFAAQQRADAVRELQRENVEAKQENGTLHMLCEDRFNEIAELRAELAAAKSEIEATKAQLAEAEKDAQIGLAVNRACRDLPAGHLIVIYLEKDAGDIQLQCPDDNFSRNDFEHEADTFGGQINAAIDAAIASQGGEKKS